MASKSRGPRPSSRKGRGASSFQRERTRTITNPSRMESENGAEKEGRDVEVKVTREVAVTSDGKLRVTHGLSVPKSLRDRPFDIDADDRMALARALVDAVESATREAHGGGVGDYQTQHFMGVFDGTMYETPEGEGRMGKQTVGTHSGVELGKTADELASRVEAILEGQTPRTTGSPSSYGYFASGVANVAMVTMMVAEDERRRVEQQIAEATAALISAPKSERSAIKAEIAALEDYLEEIIDGIQAAKMEGEDA